MWPPWGCHRDRPLERDDPETREQNEWPSTG